MGVRRKLARDTAVLTGAAIVMRCVGMAWQVWLAGRIGAAGLGLWQLVASVNVFTSTLAISGIRFTTTRLVSEELGAGRDRGALRAVGRCLGYALFFGTAAFLVMHLGAEPIGFLWVRDARTVKSLRLLAWTLPMISLSCVLNGSFVASGRAGVSAAVQLCEQLAAMAAVAALMGRCAPGDLEGCCAAIAGGSVLADGFSLALSAVLFLVLHRRGGLLRTEARRGRRALRDAEDGDEAAAGGTASGAFDGALTGRMLRLAFPLALSAYARTGLTTLENLLVPRKLRSSGLSADSALAGYGVITGMVLPVVSFPSCLLGAVAELTVPLLTADQVRGDAARIRSRVRRLLLYALAFSMACAAFLFLLAEPLGWVIYHTAEVGPYIRLFALIVPFLYCDIVIDGCLKGLGQMLWSMGFNVAEAAIGVVLILVLIPRYGLAGYIAVLFFSEVFNVTLSYWRLRKTVNAQK